MALSNSSEKPFQTSRYAYLPKPLKVWFLVSTLFGVLLSVFYIFGFTVRGEAMLPTAYYYLLIASFSSNIFLLLPPRKKERRIHWYDMVFAALVVGISIYFATQAWYIDNVGWVPPTKFHFALAFVICLLILEGGRRMAGFIYLCVCLLFGAYPLFAKYMPGLLFGFSSSFVKTIGFHAFGSEGIIGLPSKIMGEILIGFLFFAGLLVASGAGKFFLDVAQAVLGRYRGGPAKVAVVSSGFFGSLSGSALSNVVSTGSVTIPAMKRMGYPAHYAGAIEACASTGGVFMPPIMGAVAFVMCAFLGIEYSTVILAAAVPSILYYIGLLMQVDSYAARSGIKGMPAGDIPSIIRTVRAGWPFIAILFFILWGLLYMRWEVKAAYYASGLLIILSYLVRETRMTPRKIVDAIVAIGTLITQSMAMIIPIGFIVAGLAVTGTSTSFTSGLIYLAGGNLYVILFIGMAVCYILGMAGLLVSAYIFLAVTLAPALVEVGHLNVLAVHLFIVYYAMLSALTPPVAVVSFLGASLAGADPMKTAVLSMRLGFVKYFIPLFFLFNPSLIFQGTFVQGIYYFIVCTFGVVLIAAGLDGYLIGIGEIKVVSRLLLVIGGLFVAFPEWKTSVIGAVFILSFVGFLLINQIQRKRSESRSSLNYRIQR